MGMATSSFGAITKTNDWGHGAYDSTKGDSNFVKELIGKLHQIDKNKIHSIFEIGCFPCNSVTQLAKHFHATPFGLDFIEKVGEIEKEVQKIWPQALFWNEDFENFETNRKFDLVFSLGFIEHFDKWELVLNKHISLVGENGYLLISIPNLTNLRRLFMYIFDNENLKKHTRKYPTVLKMKQHLSSCGLKHLSSGYFGNPDFWYETKLPSLSRFLRKLIAKILNFVGRKVKAPKHVWASYAYVLFEKNNL